MHFIPIQFVWLASQSANSIFFAKAKRGSSRVNLRLHALPSADINDGFGDSIRQLEVHGRTGTIFFLVTGRLYRTTLSSTTATQIDQLVKSFMIQGDTLVMVKNNRFPSGNDTLEWGQLIVLAYLQRQMAAACYVLTTSLRSFW